MKFNIYGDYVDGEPYGDEIAPSKFRAATAALKKGEPLELHVNSLGGSVTSGIAIANTIRELSKSGHRTTCVVEGVAASIASITAMACDEIQIYPSAFIMIHNPWTMLMGDANALRKEADTLDKMRSALLSFYRGKFDRTDDEIVALMDAETWISGEECASYGLAVTLLEEGEKSRAAAKATLRNALAKVYKSRIDEETKLMKDEEIEKKPAEEAVEETKPAEEQPAPAEPQNPAEPTPDEEKKDAEEQTPDEPQKPEEEQPAPAEPTPDEEKKDDEEKKPDDDEPVEARLAKCQSVFQKKINDLKAEMSAQARELQTAKASVSSLEASLEQSKAELAKAQAAAADAESRLATLSANALAHTDEKPTFADGLAKCKTPEERSRFIASGNYTR